MANVATILSPSSASECAGAADCTATVETPVGVHHRKTVSECAAEWTAAWDEFVTAHPNGTLFHTLAWRNAVRSAFRHQDHYLLAHEADRVTGVLPLFLVKSRIAGRMLVSVPYGVGGGILSENPEAASALINRAIDLASTLHCRTIDLRCESACVPDVPVIDKYVGFVRELSTDPAKMQNFLPRKARAAARNAQDRFHVQIEYDDEHMDDVWRLYTISMRRLGSLAYPLSFFRELVRQTPGHHWVSIAKWEGKTVAGLVTFLFRDRVMPYFFGSVDKARQCSAANLLYLSAMQRGVEHGYRLFDFGRSRKDNIGSYNFKRFHGFMPTPLEYQRVVLDGRRPVDLSPSNGHFSIARNIWKHLPLTVTQRLGARIARHIPG